MKLYFKIPLVENLVSLTRVIPLLVHARFIFSGKNDLHMFTIYLFLETMAWENVVMDQYDDSIPRARAGHCSVAVSVGFLCWSCNMKQ